LNDSHVVVRSWIKAAEDGRCDTKTADRVRIFAAANGAADLELGFSGRVARAMGATRPHDA
jgi:hypothetical protein